MTIDPRDNRNGHAPKVVAFTCNWGAYNAAQTAGINRSPYSSDVRLVRLMCLGQLSAPQIITAFELGAIGVILLGCPPGNCHYGFGSGRVEEAFQQARELIQILGLDGSRLQLEWIRPGDSAKFAQVLSGFVETLRALEDEAVS